MLSIFSLNKELDELHVIFNSYIFLTSGSLEARGKYDSNTRAKDGEDGAFRKGKNGENGENGIDNMDGGNGGNGGSSDIGNGGNGGNGGDSD